MAKLKTIRVFIYPAGITPVEVENYGHYGQLRQEMRDCGKQHCQRCPHGPYWYLVWHEKGTNKPKKRYIGRNLQPVSAETPFADKIPRPLEIESHGVVMQLLPSGGKYNLKRVSERWEA